MKRIILILVAILLPLGVSSFVLYVTQECLGISVQKVVESELFKVGVIVGIMISLAIQPIAEYSAKKIIGK